MLVYAILGFFLVVSFVITVIATRKIFDKIGNIKDVTGAKKKADKMFFAAYFFAILACGILFAFATFELKGEDMPIGGTITLLVMSTGGIFKAIDGIREIFKDAKKEEKEEKEEEKKKRRIFF